MGKKWEFGRGGKISGKSSTLMKASSFRGSRVKDNQKMQDRNRILKTRREKLPGDDGTKPSLNYAELIRAAILGAPNKRLTLAQIYKWISDTYSFYNAANPGWQNSIRQNLSLNKTFIKQERPKDDPGRGNYWTIAHDGMFLPSLALYCQDLWRQNVTHILQNIFTLTISTAIQAHNLPSSHNNFVIAEKRR